MSLSARRAWIEIDIEDKFGGLVSVALRKESVDRNTGYKAQNLRDFVALRKESVDRNCYIAEMDEKDDRRSPQGERG